MDLDHKVNLARPSGESLWLAWGPATPRCRASVLVLDGRRRGFRHDET